MPALLDPKREAFCQHYAVHGSTTKAATAVGIHRAVGTHYINDQHVAARIRELLTEQFRHVGVTAERVKEELARVAFAKANDLVDDEGRLIPLQDLSDEVASTIASIDVEIQQKRDDRNMLVEDAELAGAYHYVTTKKIRRVDKMAALTLLARHFKIVGAEDDGVNQLANALADRLNAAKRRMGEVPQDVEDATIIEPAAADRVPALLEQEQQHERLW